MDFVEAPENVMLRQAVYDLTRKYGHRYFADKVRAGLKVDELWDDLSAQGFVGVNVPSAFGGGGAGIYELAIVGEETAAAGCPLLVLLVSPGICVQLIATYGSPEQRATWLPGLAAGRKMAFAITESEAGSNSHQIATTARHDGDQWRITGAKAFISCVDEASAVVVVARTATDAETGRGQLSLFVVDTHAPGVSMSPIPVEVALPDKQFQLYFDDVAVSADRLLGGEGEALHAVFTGLNPERIMGASLCNGVGRYALEVASLYATERRVWGGVPIGAHQGVAHPLAEAKIALESARLMTQRAAWLQDLEGESPDAAAAANMAKFASADAASRCLDVAIQTLGGNGLTTEYGLADLWGVVRLLKIAPVSREMILNYVAQHSLGLPRSYA